MARVYAARYATTRKIGGGAFRDVYAGVDNETGRDVAVKVEKKDAEYRQLQYEASVYSRLTGGAGIPRVHWFGTELDSSAMVLDLLGPNLEDLLKHCNRRLSLRTVASLASQLIVRLEYIHQKHIIHRDLKPENIVVGLAAQRNEVYLIDFGLATAYYNMETGEHIPYSNERGLIGTARYASIPSHLGVEQSRRDDMESLGYVLVYLAKGSLPWQGLQASTQKQKEDMILQEKLLTPTKEVCRGLPCEFALYLDYARSLYFKQEPDYSYPRGLFDSLSVREGLGHDNYFDWISKE